MHVDRQMGPGKSNLNFTTSDELILVCSSRLIITLMDTSIRSKTTNPVDEAIIGRHSIRGFLPKPVPDELITEILDVAARAPSGTNMQPWAVHVVKGKTRNSLIEKLTTAFSDQSSFLQNESEYKYYPVEWFEPYLSRRRKVGFDLYGLLGIKKGDRTSMKKQHSRNFSFFDAPVGLMFTIDRRLELGSWLDYGMFLQNVMIVAKARGLDTCPQAAFIELHGIISKHLAFSDDEQLVCGMSLGYADMSRPENHLKTERQPATDFVAFHQ